jgi:Uma2 family endonuclease
MVATQPPLSPETAPEILPDRWIVAPWADYQRAIEQATEKVKGYYYDGTMRLEMSPVGNPHSRDHSIINYAVLLFAALRGLRVNAHDNCTYRKIGVREAQPDLSVYVGDRVGSLDWATKIVDLDQLPPPDLAIEISDSTLPDDCGRKRLLYEDLGVREYWVVNVAEAVILGFEIIERGSRRIQESVVLPGLSLEILEAALRRSREADHGQVSAWLLEQWQTQG